MDHGGSRYHVDIIDQTDVRHQRYLRYRRQSSERALEGRSGSPQSHHRRRRYTEPLNGSLSVPWVSLVVIDPDRQGVLLAATIIMLSSSHQPIIFEWNVK